MSFEFGPAELVGCLVVAIVGRVNRRSQCTVGRAVK